MKHIDNNPFTQWQAEGRALIPQHFEEFQRLAARAKELAARGEDDAAAAYVGIAAQYAQFNHGGFFTSPEIEQILLEIGKRAIPHHQYTWRSSSPSGNPQNILHVSTNISTFSGIPRLIRRWIQQDAGRSHSLALTMQAPDKVPQILQDAVLESQGQIHILNQTPGGIVARARRLRECAATADIIVTHAWEYDVIPLIAFADKTQAPPSIYTNHGDHWFWLGASGSDVVANLRESGMRLSQQRRGIAPERNMVLPIVLEPLPRKLSRAAAKQKIGIDPASILLLSIARAPKYKTMGNINFAQAHVQLLIEHPDAVLIVIGAGDNGEDWSEAIAQTQGRIRVMGQTEQTALFYQAADIYVDSFPIPSNTSLLEAGSYGNPLVSRNPFGLETCEVLGADMPGLTGSLIQAKDLKDYTKIVSKLIEDKEYRLSLGAATQQKIEDTHWGDNWLKTLEHIYFQAAHLPRVTPASESIREMLVGELDVLLCSHSSLGKADLQKIMHWHMPFMPLAQRLELWFSLGKQYGFRSNPLNVLVSPELRSRSYQFRKSFATR